MSLETLECGRISFVTRPRVEDSGGIQRFLLLLKPERGEGRRIKVGKKRMPGVGTRDREWAFVERVGDGLMQGLGPKVYETKTRGTRHQPGARIVSEGRYAIVAHDDHTHLDWMLDDATEADASLNVGPEGSTIVLVFNPMLKAGPVDPSPFSEPSLFPDEMQAAFGGKRFGAMRPEHLDYEGAELVLTGARTTRVAS